MKYYKVENEEAFNKVFKNLREIRKERQHPAHRISKNKYDKQYIQLQEQMIEKAYVSVRALRFAFQNHPKAKSFVIPSYLDNAKVKFF